MKRRRIRFDQVVAAAVAVAIHALPIWGLALHKQAPAFAPEPAMTVSLVEAPPRQNPQSPPPIILPGSRHPLEAPAEIAQTKASALSTGAKPEPVGELTSLEPRSQQPTVGRTMVPLQTMISKPEDDLHSDYGQRVWAHLAAHAPSAPLSSGTAWVQFSLDESGALLSVRLGRSSGRPVFDRACLASIRAAQPFPQPPPGISRAGLIFEVPITAPVRTGGALKIGPR